MAHAASICDLAAWCGKDDTSRRLWKVVAYLGRYAHQPAPVSLAMPVRRLRRLLAATRELVEEEMRAHGPGGGGD